LKNAFCRERGGFEDTAPLPLYPLSPKPFEEKVCKGRKGLFKEKPPLPLHPLSSKPFENSRERQVNR